MPGTPREVLVSVQLPGRSTGGDPVHVAAGLLGDRDLVLIPSPPPIVLDPAQDLDLVMIPIPLDGDYPVERLKAWCFNRLWLGSDRARAVGAMVKLRTSSVYSRTRGPFNGGLLGARLAENGGDLWAALEALGTVRPGLRDGPPEDVLRALPDVERRQHRPTYRDHHHERAAGVGWSICTWLCICQPE